jgi:hypothetical protein
MAEDVSRVRAARRYAAHAVNRSTEGDGVVDLTPAKRARGDPGMSRSDFASAGIEEATK